MRLEQEAAMLTALDDPILREGITEVISLHDTGYDQGYLDGDSGKPQRDHPASVPALFKYTYLQGHGAGQKERQDRKVCKEIRRHFVRLGLYQGKTPVYVVEPKEVLMERPSETPGEEKKSYFKTYGPLIATFVGAGVLFGVAGLWIGKTQEQKKCMNVRREIGVD